MSPLKKKTFRIIVYTVDRDPAVKTLLEQLTNQKVFWIYETQCYEGQIIMEALFRLVAETNPDARIRSLTEDQIKSIIRKLENKQLIHSIGINDFQRQVLLKALFLAGHNDLSDPIIYIAHDYFKKPRLTLSLLWIALRVENYSKLRRIMDGIRAQRMATFKD